MPGVPGHLVRRRLGLLAEAVDRLRQHELVQLLEAMLACAPPCSASSITSVAKLATEGSRPSEEPWGAKRSPIFR